MASIRDEILRLTNPEPVLKDPENYFDQELSAKLVEKDDVGTVGNQEVSKLRRKAAGLLSDSDRKYAGKKLSRKDWMADSESDIASEDNDDEEEEDMETGDSEGDTGQYGASDGSADEDEDVNEDIEGFKSKINNSAEETGFTFADDGDYGKYADDSDDNADGDSGDDNDDDDGDDDDDDDEGDSEEEEEDIQKFSAAAQDEMAKGNAAAQQLGLWDTLLEGRIKLQKAVSLINQLPQQNAWTQFSTDSNSFDKEAKKTQKVFKHLLDSLVHLQDVLLAQNTDTVSLVDGAEKTGSGGQSKLLEDDDDEEILSDTDEEMEKQNEPVIPRVKVEKRKIEMEEYPGVLKKRYDSFHDFRDTTIQRWYDKTRLAGGKVKGKSFTAFDQSALVQIKQILSDKDRLVRRTQLKRSAYRVLGKVPKKEDPEIIPSEEGEPEVIEKSNTSDKNNDYDAEIFDDDDFYHQLLRELIQKKTADINDPIASTRQWLQIQRLRSKKKRIIDPKASKDRKIKYTVHKKLVNFMTPIDDCEWSHEARDDLFKSLFGKRHTDNS